MVKGGSRTWVFRGPTIKGKRSELGLGSAFTVSVAMARKERDAKLEQLRNGIDPLTEKRKAKEAAATAAKRKTFIEAADAVIEKDLAAPAGRLRSKAGARRSTNGVATPTSPASRSHASFSTRSPHRRRQGRDPALLGSGAARQRPVLAEAHRGDLRLRHRARLALG